MRGGGGGTAHHTTTTPCAHTGSTGAQGVGGGNTPCSIPTPCSHLGHTGKGWGGSSRGGLAALVTALRHQETFSAVMGLSATTLSAITGGDFAAYAASHPRRAPIRFSLDYGDAEVVYGNNATELIGAMNSAVSGLTAAGFDSAAITTAIIPGAVHNEAAWAARLPGRLAWLLDPTAP